MPTVDIEKPQTFAAFEGKVSGNTVKGVSLLQKGPALGHGMWVDNVMLEQVKKLAGAKGKLKAKINHWTGLDDTVGYYENFRIRAGKLIADLSLFESAPQSAHLLEMIEAIPASFGVSIVFSGDEPEYDKEEDRYYARARELYSADFVDTPAANRDGVFEAEIDKAENDMPAISVEAFDAYKSEAAAASAALAEQLSALTAKLAELQTSLESKKEDPALPPAAEPKPFEQFDAKLEALKETLLKAFAAAPKASDQQAAPANDQQDADPLLITRAQFEAIHPNQRGAFFAKGGKIKA